MNSGTVKPCLVTKHSLGNKERYCRVVSRQAGRVGKEKLCRQITFSSFFNALPPPHTGILATSLIIDTTITALILCQALLSYMCVSISFL